MKQTIHLIRHGKTYANKMKMYTGSSDLPVTSEGISELKIYKGKGYYPENISYCILSNLSRTKQTMDIIYPNAKYIKTPLLNECCFGDFEMHNFDELKTRKDYQTWLNDETNNYCPPNGESWNMFYNRCKEGFLFAIKTGEELNLKEYAIICHGGVISVIMNLFFNDNRSHFERVPKNGCGITVEVEKENEEYICKIKDYIVSSEKNDLKIK